MSSVTAGYDRTTVLRDVTLNVPAGAIVALLGPNGAGKTTLLRAAAGLLGSSTKGTIHVAGEEVTRLSPSARAQRGLCLIPEGRGVFRTLTVRENLRLFSPPKGAADRQSLALEAFPILKKRLGQAAGTMSGGEQQMLALARCYLTSPKVILLDEVSMGLAPKIVDEIFAALQKIASTGTSLLLVEQYVTRALDMADQVLLLNRGRVEFDGPPGDLEADAVLRGYLGVEVKEDSTPT